LSDDANTKKLPLSWEKDAEGKRKRLWLKCHKCGETWYPNANKWNTEDTKNGKVLRCPNCAAYIKIPPSVVNYLKSQSRKYLEPEFGLDEPPIKKKKK
jgi:DNA-directed RNA polymerase subunit RPC12/RpoP